MAAASATSVAPNTVTRDSIRAGASSVRMNGLTVLDPAGAGGTAGMAPSFHRCAPTVRANADSSCPHCPDTRVSLNRSKEGGKSIPSGFWEERPCLASSGSPRVVSAGVALSAKEVHGEEDERDSGVDSVEIRAYFLSMRRVAKFVLVPFAGILAVFACLVAPAAGAAVQPRAALQATGPLLLDEDFTGATAISEFTGYGTACLTARGHDRDPGRHAPRRIRLGVRVRRATVRDDVRDGHDPATVTRPRPANGFLNWRDATAHRSRRPCIVRQCG